MKKIRFYHWWIYRLFYWAWSPILKERPDLVKVMRDWNQSWLDRREQRINHRRKSIKIIK